MSLFHDIAQFTIFARLVGTGTKSASRFTLYTRCICCWPPPLFTLVAAAFFIAPAVGTTALLARTIRIQTEPGHTKPTTAQVLVAIPAVFNFARKAPSTLMTIAALTATVVTLDGLRIGHVDSTEVQRCCTELAAVTILDARVATSLMIVGACNAPARVAEAGPSKFARLAEGCTRRDQQASLCRGACQSATCWVLGRHKNCVSGRIFSLNAAYLEACFEGLHGLVHLLLFQQRLVRRSCPLWMVQLQPMVGLAPGRLSTARSESGVVVCICALQHLQ
mmetsp:Transcript_52559/g.114734  ORF Transcript_52559/g.114734 Transcript_52559/m.114734 type:complete len:278 (-) Transcript_52559:491-1324(-)